MSTRVPKGISGRQIIHDTSAITDEMVKNELALLALGDFEPLDIKIDIRQYEKEMKLFDNDWVEYLPKTDRENNRYGMSFTAMPGDDHTTVPSLGELCYREGRRVSENEVCEPTELYDAVTSLHPIFNLFDKLGRTYVVKSGLGGYFPPHRDHPVLNRDSFRLIVFTTGVDPYDYDWIMNNQKMMIEPGRVYYVNTMKTHRTISWNNNSQHVIINVPMTSENVAKVIAHYQHRH